MTLSDGPRGGGSYSLGRDQEAVAHMQARVLDRHAAFTQHLRPGMRLLDAGCGPGSVTMELAALVAPGEVVGVDSDAAILARATALLAERRFNGLPVRFERGDIYSLPYPDASFDAVWSQFVFCHLREPVTAMREIRRVLRPGGVFGVMDPDHTLVLFEPESGSQPTAHGALSTRPRVQRRRHA